jgi:hypothetical protein
MFNLPANASSDRPFFFHKQAADCGCSSLQRLKSPHFKDRLVAPASITSK